MHQSRSGGSIHVGRRGGGKTRVPTWRNSGRSASFDDDRAGRGACEAILVGDDVVDRIGRSLRSFDREGRHRDAIEIGGNVQVEVGLRAGDRRAEVTVARADLDDGGVCSVDLNNWRCVDRFR